MTLYFVFYMAVMFWLPHKIHAVQQVLEVVIIPVIIHCCISATDQPETSILPSPAISILKQHQKALDLPNKTPERLFSEKAFPTLT